MFKKNYSAINNYKKQILKKFQLNKDFIEIRPLSEYFNNFQINHELQE